MKQETRILLELLKIALWDAPPDEKIFAAIDENLWQKVIGEAARHRVKAVAFDGAMRLPKSMQPAHNQCIQWAVYVDAAEKKYAYKWQVLQELDELFRKNGIQMLSFKGFSLARYYPVPEHREFGDLDIYLCGKHDEGNRILTENGAKSKGNDRDRHSVTTFRGIMVENHNYFLNVTDSRKLALMNDKLLKIAENQPDNELFPNVLFMLIEHVCHTTHHFARGGVSLRFLTDWAVLLDKNKDKFDYSEFRDLLQASDLLQITDVYTALCVKLLGLKTNFHYTANPLLENPICEEITNPSQLRLTEKNPSEWKKFMFNLKHFYRQHRNFELVYPREDFKRVAGSIAYHIKHPSTLFHT